MTTTTLKLPPPGSWDVSWEGYEPFKAPEGTTDLTVVMLAHISYLEAKIASLHDRLSYLENRPRFP